MNVDEPIEPGKQASRAWRLPAAPCRHRHAPSARPAPCPLGRRVRVLGQALPVLRLRCNIPGSERACGWDVPSKAAFARQAACSLRAGPP